MGGGGRDDEGVERVSKGEGREVRGKKEREKKGMEGLGCRKV